MKISVYYVFFLIERGLLFQIRELSLFKLRLLYAYVKTNVSLLLSQGDHPSPLAILTGHEQPVVCVDVSASLGIVVSGSQGMLVS